MRLRFRRISRVLIRRSWYCVSNAPGAEIVDGLTGSYRDGISC